MRRVVIALFTFLGGLYYFFEFILPEEAGLSEWLAPIGEVFLVIGAFAIGLGVINLIGLHLGRIARRRSGWINSLALIISMLAMMIFHIWGFYSDSETIKQIRDLLFLQMLNPLESTTFALLAFYIASAAYRAFRIRSAEASLMMFTALIVMLGQISVGQWLTSKLAEFPPFLDHLQVQVLRDWIMSVWNGAAQRGIFFGSAIGGLALSLRIWLSLEKGSFFDQQL
jgi:hypothetical protein